MTDQKVKIKLKGNLGGYSLRMKMKDRREKLTKLIKSKKFSPVEVIRKLNVLYIFNKNKKPEIAKKFRRDMKYVQKTF